MVYLCHLLRPANKQGVRQGWGACQRLTWQGISFPALTDPSRAVGLVILRPQEMHQLKASGGGRHWEGRPRTHAILSIPPPSHQCPLGRKSRVPPHTGREDHTKACAQKAGMMGPQ